MLGVFGGDDQVEILWCFFGMLVMFLFEEQKYILLGLGFIIFGDGYILINNYVVDYVDEVMVCLQDCCMFIVKVVGIDFQYDIVLLKVSIKDILLVVCIGEL